MYLYEAKKVATALVTQGIIANSDYETFKGKRYAEEFTEKLIDSSFLKFGPKGATTFIKVLKQSNLDNWRITWR